MKKRGGKQIVSEREEKLFDFLWEEVIIGSGGDGDGIVITKDTPPIFLATKFLEWIKENKNCDFSYIEESDYCLVYDNQESVKFTRTPPISNGFYDVVLYIY